MNVDEFTGHLKTAESKLVVNGGAASALKGNLDSAAGALHHGSVSTSMDAKTLRANWTGGKGTTFEGKSDVAPTQLDGAAGEAEELSHKIGSAQSIVQQAHADVQRLIDEFTTFANRVIAAVAGQPQLQAQARGLLTAEAANYADAASKIVTAAKQALSNIAGGSGGGTSAQGGGGSGGGGGGGGSSDAGSIGSNSGGGGGGGGSGASTGAAVMVPPPKNNYNDGTTAVKLPGGQTVQAPNPRAAAAVRAALSRLGLPYVWGGTSPTGGMDCSGLTQWSYGQAGVKLPRTAKTQTVGQKIPMGQQQPGDLLIWSGHVCMYIGDGKIVEEPQTGDVCHIRPMRTTNCGEPFYGIFRPSA